MLLKKQTLDSITRGEITLVFRRWKRPTVKEGGTLRTAVGMLNIKKCDKINLSSISSSDARDAGYDSLTELKHALRRGTGDVYRIVVAPGRTDPLLSLREEIPTAQELAGLATSLAKSDERSSFAVSSFDLLSVISDNPAVRAADLASMLDVQRDDLKKNVRKLKSKGLTISLERGYKLSERGKHLLRYLSRHRAKQ